VGWHPSDAGGPVSALEDDPTGDKLQVMQSKKMRGALARIPA